MILLYHLFLNPNLVYDKLHFIAFFFTMLFFFPPGPVRIELDRHQKPDQHSGHPWPQARKHLCVPGPGPHRGWVWTLQWQTVLPDHD